MDAYLVAGLVVLALLAVTLGCLLADRAARIGAWRRITEERRRLPAPGDDQVGPPRPGPGGLPP